MKIYDLIIIGAGPAGTIAAKTVISKGLSVLIIDKGLNLNKRRDLTTGWFGHGLFAMNKLELDDKLLNNQQAIREIIKLIKKISCVDLLSEKICRLSNNIGKEFASYLFNIISVKTDIIFNAEVNKIEKKDELFVIKTTNKDYLGRKCLITTGKNSIEWIENICNDLNINKINKGVKIGVRVEIPTFKVNKLAENNDINVKVNNTESEDTRINSFVGEWEESNIISAFGYNMINKESQKTNFMVGFESKIEISEIIRNIKIINVLANDRIKKERVVDFMEGKSILKYIKSFDGIKEVFDEMEKILPMFSNYAVMYVPEIRLKGILPVDENMRTSIPKLYGAGECTTRVSNLMGAMASGLIVAKTILKE